VKRLVNQPRPEERAPKSGLPDFGISMVSKSATADFDSRILKDGHMQHHVGAGWPDAAVARRESARPKQNDMARPMVSSGARVRTSFGRRHAGDPELPLWPRPRWAQ